MGFKVLIPQEISNVGTEYLLEHGYEIKMGSGITQEQIIEDVDGCDAMLVRLSPITKDVLSAGTKLKVVARYGSGYDTVDFKAAQELGIWVTNTPIPTNNLCCRTYNRTYDSISKKCGKM